MVNSLRGRRRGGSVLVMATLLAGAAGALPVSEARGPQRVPSPPGEIVDCNANGIDDAIDIADGTSADCDGSGVPDECEALPVVPITVEPVVSGLTQPVALEFPPGDPDRLFIVEKIGVVKIYDLSTGTLLPTPFLDISAQVSISRERGLLDIEFDPDHATNGFFYVSYNALAGGAMTIARYTVSGDPDVADAGSEVVLKTIPHTILAHNGGQLQFGPLDGFLYFSSGDGSNASQADPDNNAQSGAILHGKMLRLDVDNPPDYIAAGNPYIGDPTAFDEIWARGLRNPWRFSFDRLTGDMYIGDVGWRDREEIDYEPAGSAGGRNYGWRCMEGSLCTGLAGCTCNDPGLTLPVHELQHDLGDGTCSVIGGYVYRGCAIPHLAGRYFYADHCGAYIRSLLVQPDGMGGGTVVDMIDHTPELNPAGAIELPTAFGEDPLGELYLASIAGAVWKIVPIADCNDNGTPDDEDIATGFSQDCNGNGIPDECDLASGFSQDCNGNLEPDDCEFGTAAAFSSPQLTPIGDGSPQSYVIPDAPIAVSDVVLTISARADVASLAERLDLDLNGFPVGSVFGDNTGHDCPAVPDVAVRSMTGPDFNAAVALGGGDATFTVVGSIFVNAAQCNPASWVRIDVDYTTYIDCNHNDVADGCDIHAGTSLDANVNGLPDECECPQDCSPVDTVVDVSDLLSVLAQWGQAGTSCDTDGSGTVDVGDLLEVLGAWGRCF